MAEPSPTRLVYVTPSEAFFRCCAELPVNQLRDRVVHDLISAVPNLLGTYWDNVSLKPAGKADLLLFHSEDYVKTLKSFDSLPFEELEEFGLVDDCPVFPSLYSHARLVAGGTLVAVRELCLGRAKVAVWWGGGRHHGMSDEARGFCYVNDIVIGCRALLRTFESVLVVDIDAHHGDGVEEAFITTDKVMTVSFHRYETAFYPGTGGLGESPGIGSGAGYNINVPLKAGAISRRYRSIFRTVMDEIRRHLRPGAIVIQCGTDALARDRLGGLNVSSDCLSDCVNDLADWDLPMLLVGGGGYTDADSARTWTKTMAKLAQRLGREELADLVPECEYFSLYGPDFKMLVREAASRDENSDDSVSSIASHVCRQIARYHGSGRS